MTTLHVTRFARARARRLIGIASLGALLVLVSCSAREDAGSRGSGSSPGDLDGSVDAGAGDAGVICNEVTNCQSTSCRTAACVNGACVRTLVAYGTTCGSVPPSVCIAGACVETSMLDGGAPDPEASCDEATNCFAVDECEIGLCVGDQCTLVPGTDGRPCGGGSSSICAGGECVLRRCGDGYRERGPEPPAEGCDDGNDRGGDGCDPICWPEVVSIEASASDDRASVGTSTAQNLGVDGQGRVLVVYRRRERGLESLHAQRLDANGASLEDGSLVLDAALGLVPTSADPTVAGLSSGGWIVVWVATRSGSRDVVFRRVETSGALGPEIVANRFRSGTQLDPEIVALDSGFVIGWTDLYGAEDDAGSGVVVRVFTESGLGLTADWRIASDRRGREGQLTLAANGQSWMAAWQSARDDDGGLPEVRARTFVSVAPTAAADTVVPFGPLDTPDAIALPRTNTYGLLARDFGSDPSGDLLVAQIGSTGRFLGGRAVTASVSAPNAPSPVGLSSWALAPGDAPALVFESDRYRRAKLQRYGLSEYVDYREELASRLATSAVGQLSVIRDSAGLWFGFEEDVADPTPGNPTPDGLEDVFSVFHLPTPDGDDVSCPPGYEGDGCFARTPDCSASPCQNGGTCAAVSGASDPTLRACTCAPGYRGVRCQLDANDCASPTTCGANVGAGSCWDVQAGYECTCAPGYVTQGSGSSLTCVDVDECAIDNGGCSTSPMVVCTNSPGGHACAPCPSGYSGDGRTCTDVDECTTGNGGCSVHATCTNTSGGRTCACQSGYVGDGVSCSPVSCGPPAELIHGTIATPNGTSYPQIATYVCNEGYTRSGTQTRTCQADGHWSGTAPTCVAVSCGSIGSAPVHGSVTTPNGTSYPESATYVCDAGYQLVGSATRTCQSNGVWAGVAPTCSPVDCGAPSAPSNGSVSTPSGTTYTQTATYACNVGYVRVGSASRTCQASTTWSGSAPTCAVATSFCGSAPVVSNASAALLTGGLGGNGTSSYGATASYACNTGYSKSGSDATCQASGTWSTPPTCTAVASFCGSAPVVSNASAASVSGGAAGGTTTSYGATAAYTCNTGYTKSGSNATCQASGTWSTPPTCTIVNCGALTMPTNGTVSTASGTTYNKVATYACNAGYSLSGSATRTCQANGSWSGSAPTCAAIGNYCGSSAPTVTNAAAATVSGGIAGGTTPSLGATAAYTCNTGYTKSGSNATCQAGGTWSTPPTCTIVNCGAPLGLTNGTYTGSTTYNSTISTNCKGGFFLTGATSRTCQANGTWSGVPTACIVSGFAGDFDSDGRRDDHATFVPGSTSTSGVWKGRRTEDTNIFSGVSLGGVGDVPLVGDFDADGTIDDLAVFHPATGTWDAKRTNGTSIFSGIWFGQLGDVPLVGDFDGDGKVDDLGAWRPSTGAWYSLQWDVISAPFSALVYGTNGDVPMVGSFDSDGLMNDLVVWRPSTGAWYATRTSGGAIGTNVLNGFVYGANGDRPFIGDIDGDTYLDDLGYVRSADGTSDLYWNAIRINNTSITSSFLMGYGYHQLVVGDFDADNRFDDFAIYDALFGTWTAMRKEGGTEIMYDIQ